MDRARLSEIVSAIADRLEGDWLLLGGALVSLWLEPRRVTEDLDVVGLRGTPDERLRLLGLAADLDLPVEALNSAADYFLRRVEGWEEEIEVFRRGRRGTIHRPTPTLFLLLKASRLSERDLEDCRALLARVRREGLPLDAGRVLRALEGLPGTRDEALRARRDRLRRELGREA